MNRFTRHMARISGREGFVPDVLTLLSGTTVALGLAYLARPILTRLFTPAEFGILGFFVALVAVLSAAAAWRYEDALVLPEDEKEGASLLALCLWLVVVTTLVSFVFVGGRYTIAGWFDKPEVAPYLAWVPLGVFASGMIRVTKAWLTRGKRFASVSVGEVTHNAVRVPVQLGAGWMQWGAGGLIGGLLAGQMASAGVLFMNVLQKSGALVWAGMNGMQMRRMARRYQEFATYGMPSSLMNIASVRLPELMLLFFFDPQVIGWYAQAYGVLGIPISLVGVSVARVFFVNAAEAHRAGRLQPLTMKVYRQLAMLGLFPALALTVSGPDVFEFVLGPLWRQAGVYVQYLSAWLFFVLVSSPLSRLFDVLEKQRENFFFNIALFVTRAASLLIGGWQGDAVLAIALFGISGAVLWLLHTLWMLRFGGVSLRDGFAVLFRYAAYAVLPLAMLVWVQYLGPHPGWICAAVVGCALVYYGLVFWKEGGWIRPRTTA